MKLTRNAVFLLSVCAALAFYSCGTSKGTRKQGSCVAETTEADSIESLMQYKSWQNRRVALIEPVVSDFINNGALYAHTDTTLSVFIPASDLFKPNSSTPFRSAALSLFGELARLLSEYPELSLCVAAHESADKNDDYNLHLSTKRAKNLLLLFNEKREEDSDNLPRTGRCVPPYFVGYGSGYLTRLNDFPHNALIEFRLTPCK